MNTIARRNNRVFIMLAGLLAVAWALKFVSTPAMPEVAQITPVEVAALVETGRTLIIDVREKAAYEAGHLPGAISVPIGELDGRLEEFADQRAEDIVVYCNDGSTRGPRATDTMNRAGYGGARNLDGGVEGWRKAGFETVMIR